MVNFLYSLNHLLHEGDLHLNVNEQHKVRREEFYGKVSPSLKEAVEAYRKKFEGVADLVDYVFLARNESSGLLALVLAKKSCQDSPRFHLGTKIAAPLSS